MRSISNEIKAFLVLADKKRCDLSAYMGFPYPQTLNNKFARESWSVSDLIKVAAFLDGELILRVGGREVKLTEDYITEKYVREGSPRAKSAKSAESTD